MQEKGDEGSPVIGLQGVCVRRGPTTILDHVDWRVRRGEHWVLLGANGSGKTSLLNVMAGYLAASEGRISVCGREFGAFPWQELRTLLGIVSTSLGQRMNDDVTTLEVVASGRDAVLNPWQSYGEEDNATARALLADAQLPHLEQRQWRHLSQGERQRVLICRALMASPQLLILDEPCSGLDPVARERFLVYMESVARKADGPPVLLVTHHVEEITPAFTHALVLRSGRVVAAGPLEHALTEPVLSDAFGAPVRLSRNAGRWELSAKFKVKSAKLPD